MTFAATGSFKKRGCHHCCLKGTRLLEAVVNNVYIRIYIYLFCTMAILSRFGNNTTFIDKQQNSTNKLALAS